MNNSIVKIIASNTAFQIMGKFVSMAITVAVTVIIARYYGREGYGEFSIMQSWPALFYVIVDFGLNAIAVRELSKDWSKAQLYFNTILTLRTLFSVLLVIIISTVALVFPYSDFLKTGLILTLWLILTQGLYATNNIIFQAKLKYDYSTKAYLMGYAVILLITAFAVYFKLNVIYLSFSYVVGGLVTFIAGTRYINKLGIFPQFSLNIKTARYLIIQSLPLGLMFIFSQINFKCDSILMSLLPLNSKYGYSNSEAVALYSLPYKIFEVSLVIPTFFMNSIYPFFVKNLIADKKVFLETFKKSVKILVLSAVVLGAIIFLLAPIIINMLGGPAFLPSVAVLRILSVGLILYFLTQPLSWFLVALDKQVYLPWIYLISAIFNIVANLIFIPKYAIYASPVITHVSELIVLVLLIIAARKAWKQYNA